MTNNKDNKASIFDYELVVVEATSIQLVDEVLEEACIIVNTANDSNDPWKYISCLKKYKCQDDAFNHNLTFVINKDCLKNIKLDSSIITSTPQKGQGDEEGKLVNGNSTVNSTSLYISQLFDMTELAAAEEDEIIGEIKESDVSIVEDITKIIDHCVDISVGKVLTPERNECDCKELLKDNSDQPSQSNLSEEVNEVIETTELVDFNNINKMDATKRYDKPVEATEKKINENICLEDLCSYENAYLSLNRDYEQDLDILELKLQDPRKLILQEVDLTPEQDVVKNENLEMPTSSKNANPQTDSRKRTLVYRCRLQSRKILARLRSWIWRRPMRKYKISRGWTGADRGMSPLSPSSKRRAASLLDHWQIRGTFSHNAWKFNTISGAFVNSTLWKELGSKVQFKRSY